MSRVIGYWRPLHLDEDRAADVAALKASGARKVIVAATPSEQHSNQPLDDLEGALAAGDTVVVTRAARLAASMQQLIATIAGLEDRGIRFRSLAEPALDTTVEDGGAGDTFAALERVRRELISIRTREGLADAALKGRRPGRPTVMTEEKTAMARELRDAGHSIAHIGRVLGVSASAVSRALKLASTDQ